MSCSFVGSVLLLSSACTVKRVPVAVCRSIVGIIHYLHPAIPDGVAKSTIRHIGTPNTTHSVIMHTRAHAQVSSLFGRVVGVCGAEIRFVLEYGCTFIIVHCFAAA